MIFFTIWHSIKQSRKWCDEVCGSPGDFCSQHEQPAEKWTACFQELSLYVDYTLQLAI